MTDRLIKFLEEASKDNALTGRINNAPDADTVIALARERGFDLTKEDLQPAASVRALEESELEAVAGGKECACVIGGGGEASNYYKSRDLVCACVMAGVGYGADKTEDYTPVRCVCAGAGAGGLCVLHSDKV